MDSNMYDNIYSSQGSSRRQGRSAGLENLERAKKAKDLLFEIINKIYKSSASCYDRSPFRSACVRAHSSWTSQMLLLVFIFALTSYYGESPIKCIEHYDRSRAPPYIEDICIQHPYTMNASESMRDGKRHYAYQYMWYHWTCIGMAAIFWLNKIAIGQLENKNFSNVLKKLDDTYDYMSRMKTTLEYYQKSYGDHYGMLKNVLILYVSLIFTNIGTFIGFDVLLHQKYRFMIRYIFLKRDLTYFDDEFSMAFPPFAYCEITPDMHIQVGRTNLYGCHLPLNELYAIFFVALWCWQVFLFIWAIFDLTVWFYKYCNYTTGKDFLSDGSYKKFPDVKEAAKNLQNDEALALSLIKPSLFGPHYRQLIQALAIWEPNETPLAITSPLKNPNFPQLLSRLPIVQQEELNNHVETFFFDITENAFRLADDLDILDKFNKGSGNSNDKEDGKRKDDEYSSKRNKDDKNSKDKDDKYTKDDKDKSDKKSDKEKDKVKSQKPSDKHEHEQYRPPLSFKPSFHKLFDTLIPAESNLKKYDESLSSKSTLLSDNPLSLSSFHKSPINSTLVEHTPSAPTYPDIGFKSYSDLKSEKSDPKKSKKIKDSDDKDKHKKDDDDDKKDGNETVYYEADETPKTSTKNKKKKISSKLDRYGNSNW